MHTRIQLMPKAKVRARTLLYTYVAQQSLSGLENVQIIIILQKKTTRQYTTASFNLRGVKLQNHGMQSNTAPPPYSFETVAQRPTTNSLNASSPVSMSMSYNNAGSSSEPSSLHELGPGEGSIPQPGDTGVTRMYTHLGPGV